MKQPDILIFLSDQHTPYFSGYFGGNVDTPNMDDIARNGVNFSACYSACPLCVPSRMSMLSTLMPNKTGVYTNGDTLANTTPTFLHPLVAAGYETVLIGRMHFLGQDQRHGFTKRVAPDETPVSWADSKEEQYAQKGILVPTFSDFAATKVVGGGESPVMHYDDMVIERALAYLSEEHEKPQFIVVGTYGPHFPYITTPELFQKYMARVETPSTLHEEPGYMNELLKTRKRPVSDEVAKGCVAAYSGLVELQDQLLGKVRDAFHVFTRKRNTRSLFFYLSDHGDQVGDRDIYGKNTFFEKSVRVPFLVEGDDVAKGVEVKENVSLLDIGPTLWDYLSVDGLEETDGVSLVPYLQESQTPHDGEAKKRIVLSELFERKLLPSAPPHHARMAIQGNLKYITYHNYESQDMAFDVAEDPLELHNIIDKVPQDALAQLKAACASLGDAGQLEYRQRLHERNKKLFSAYEKATLIHNEEMWSDNPPTARGQLEVAVTEPWDGNLRPTNRTRC